MVEIKIPDDILRYKTTLVGPLTTRQTICVTICAGVNLGVYTLLKLLGIEMNIEAVVRLGVFLSMPILAFGIAEPYGMPLEKYLKNVFLLYYIAPKDRPYKTCTFDKNKERKKHTKQKKLTDKELKSHPEYISYL